MRQLHCWELLLVDRVAGRLLSSEVGNLFQNVSWGPVPTKASRYGLSVVEKNPTMPDLSHKSIWVHFLV